MDGQDSYACVSDAIHELDVDCVHISGTALCQLANLGINKPFKVRLQYK